MAGWPIMLHQTETRFAGAIRWISSPARLPPCSSPCFPRGEAFPAPMRRPVDNIPALPWGLHTASAASPQATEAEPRAQPSGSHRDELPRPVVQSGWRKSGIVGATSQSRSSRSRCARAAYPSFTSTIAGGMRAGAPATAGAVPRSEILRRLLSSRPALQPREFCGKPVFRPLPISRRLSRSNPLRTRGRETSSPGSSNRAFRVAGFPAARIRVKSLPNMGPTAPLRLGYLPERRFRGVFTQVGSDLRRMAPGRQSHSASLGATSSPIILRAFCLGLRA